MGRRGPAKKPTALRILHGDESRTINRDEPQPGPGVPDPPADMPLPSRAVWDYVVGELAAMNLAKRPDRDQLFAYVEAVRMHAEAVHLVRGKPLIADKDGIIRVNPAVRVVTATARTMLLYAREFGLTPASRVNLKAESIAEDHAERLLS